jgi:hypothetical protein
MSNLKFSRTQERYYSPHHRLFQIARIALEDAIKSNNGLELNILKAVTFSALGAEAFLNALGYRANLEWETFERCATGEKLEILCGYFNLPFEKTLEPWQALDCLFQLRNDIVHGKPEHLRTEHFMPEAGLEKTKFSPPKSSLEKHLTIGNANRYFGATKNMIETFRKFVPQEIAFEIFQDGWSGSTSLT